MPGPNVQLRFGNPSGVADVAAQIRAQGIIAAAQATVDRVKARVDHEAAQTLEVRGVNQYAAQISGPRGGPGPIVPVNGGSVLVFEVAGETVYAKQVMGVGLGPLIEAESQRIELSDIDVDSIRVK